MKHKIIASQNDKVVINVRTILISKNHIEMNYDSN